MLCRLLEILRSGGTHSLRQLAGQLAVSEVLLRSMVDDLARMGYLRQLTGACRGHCEGCPLASACTLEGSGQVWVLVQLAAKV